MFKSKQCHVGAGGFSEYIINFFLLILNYSCQEKFSLHASSGVPCLIVVQHSLEPILKRLELIESLTNYNYHVKQMINSYLGGNLFIAHLIKREMK